jgi:hypothetical protein
LGNSEPLRPDLGAISCEIGEEFPLSGKDAFAPSGERILKTPWTVIRMRPSVASLTLSGQ